MLKITPIKQNRFFRRPVRPIGAAVVERSGGGTCRHPASGGPGDDSARAKTNRGGQRAEAVEEEEGERTGRGLDGGGGGGERARQERR